MENRSKKELLEENRKLSTELRELGDQLMKLEIELVVLRVIARKFSEIMEGGDAKASQTCEEVI